MKYTSTEKRLTAVAAIFMMLFAIVIIRYYNISVNKVYAGKYSEYGKDVLKIYNGDGVIYDRNMTPLVNYDTKFMTAAVCTKDNYKYLRKVARDKETFDKLAKIGKPFVFESTESVADTLYTTCFKVPVRNTEKQLACHLIGYTANGSGVSGMEYAYDKLLRSETKSFSTVSYETDGSGSVLVGEGKKVSYGNKVTNGVVTTIDSEIQRICEKTGNSMGKGAVIVADISTGDILAMASFPQYSFDDIESAMSDSRSPLINRCLYDYSLGSIFKLVTACQAIKSGYCDYKYTCTGSADIKGQVFGCHLLSGHGEQNMTQAMTNSCNPYFITLSTYLDAGQLRDTAFTLGFGREIQLCNGVVGASGYLPTTQELSVPAELANFSFGQGKLTATPLQVSQMTCAIANDGIMPILRVVKGLTSDGKNVDNQKNPQLAYTMEENTAKKLQGFMSAAVNNNEESNAKPYNTMTAGKTSTAQTGRFDENGTELCNAWITGFFPVYKPKYAVTVLVEDGGYGNTVAAPIFREIIEKIVRYQKSN